MAIKKDQYAQFMRLSCTMSAADTLTFAQVSIGTILFEYAAFVLHRVEYQYGYNVVALMTAESDRMIAAICGADSIADLSLVRPEVYDKVELFNGTMGAAVAAEGLCETPIIHDFTGLPGGGQLVPASDIYLAMTSVGLASAGNIEARLWYTVRELVAADYFELVQRLRVLTT